ncbi:uncharacterized protein A1O9_09498 [Exophiala aquamarina CBS 119918]|uniref:Enoyl reductase (ER) domain-containing protein n=1 Tax=Exophiala aquamarina CBS 119918 TaxID=1182545 RepID=A0A072P3R7_9EURO|nr:uncharacterized protein A1O9_09498 [Exophiala aquamarina CBS 119918]KEF54332.1 hypothetical protein A1O9_09498 [Exophiala aquamarina CBS 119918]
MRGWIHTSRGPASEVLSLSDSLALPTTQAPNDVLVKVRHAALNPAGSIFMRLCPLWLRNKPCIPEMDFSGELVSVGTSESVPLLSKDRGLKPGLQVFGSIPVGLHLKGQGALGEYVVVDSECIVAAPQTLPLAEAAGLPIAGCTALSLLDGADLKNGQKVLINGAAGGIGSLIMQMARHALGPESHIVAVSSREKLALLKELGADEVLDRKSVPSVPQYLTERHSKQPFDVIIDAYGVQELYTNCASFLKADGMFVTVGIAFLEYSYGSMFVAVKDMLRNILVSAWGGHDRRRYVQVSSTSSLEGLERLKAMCEDQNMRVPIDSSWAFDDVVKVRLTSLLKSHKLTDYVPGL